jgi:hypothetical protein
MVETGSNFAESGSIVWPVRVAVMNDGEAR